jgi:hypothetical protein
MSGTKRNRNDFKLNILFGDLLRHRSINRSKIPRWTNPLRGKGNSNVEGPKDPYNIGAIPYDWNAIDSAMSLGKFSQLKKIQFYFNKYDADHSYVKDKNNDDYVEERIEYARDKLTHPLATDVKTKEELNMYLAQQKKIYMDKLKKHMIKQLGKNSKNTKDKVNKLEKLIASEGDEDEIDLLEEDSARLIEDLGALDKYISEWSGDGGRRKTRKNIRKK